MVYTIYGILSGKRNPNHRAGQGYDPAFNGGIIKVKYDTFENNYVDIMFEDWNVGGICKCWYNRSHGEKYQSEIHYNYFGRLAGAGHCTNSQYVGVRITYCIGLPTAYPPNPPDNIQERCHILDFAAYQGLSATVPIGGYYWNWCERAYQHTSDPDNNPGVRDNTKPEWEDPVFNVTYGNIYFEDTHPPCGCRCNKPHDNFH